VGIGYELGEKKEQKRQKHFVSIDFETFHLFSTLFKLHSGASERGITWPSQIKKVFRKLALFERR